MATSHAASTFPVRFGFVLGLLGGAMVSVVVVGILTGYFLGGSSPRTTVRLAQGAAPAPTTVPVGASLPAAPPPRVPDPVQAIDTAADHVRGDPAATVTLVEYADFECPYCRQHHATLQALMDVYPPTQVSWVYRHFPLGSHHSAAKGAEASECAAELGGEKSFWAYTDALFAQTVLDPTSFVPLAGELNLDATRFSACLDAGTHVAKVRAQQQSGVAAAVRGTPSTFMINNATGERRVLPGAVSLDELRSAIDDLLAF